MVRLGAVLVQPGELVASGVATDTGRSQFLMGQGFKVRVMDGMNGCCHSFGFGWSAFDPLDRLGALADLGPAGVCWSRDSHPQLVCLCQAFTP